MIIREAGPEDLEGILRTIEEAQAFLREQGVNQWQNGYPTRAVLEQDIAEGTSWVLVQGEEVAAVACISFAGEPTYNLIYDGQWLSEPDADYAVIHRVAVRDAYRGSRTASVLFRHAELLCREEGVGSIRVDTHRDNAAMRRFLLREGFTLCGSILLEDKTERLAYEKILEQ